MKILDKLFSRLKVEGERIVNYHVPPKTIRFGHTFSNEILSTFTKMIMKICNRFIPGNVKLCTYEKNYAILSISKNIRIIRNLMDSLCTTLTVWIEIYHIFRDIVHLLEKIAELFEI